MTPPSTSAAAFPMPEGGEIAGVISEHAGGKTNEFNQSYVLPPQGPDRRASDRDNDDDEHLARTWPEFASEIMRTQGILAFIALGTLAFMGHFVLNVHPQWTKRTDDRINENAERLGKIATEIVAGNKEVAKSIVERIDRNENAMVRELDKLAASIDRKTETAERQNQNLQALTDEIRRDRAARQRP